MSVKYRKFKIVAVQWTASGS